MAYRYVVLDVFTDRPLSGNPLAVFPEAAGLDDGQMQAIAREFNLSETVFVFPPANPRHSATVRIFTPQSELPFAGHPTVGTAVLIAIEKTKHLGPGRHEMMVLLDEKVGLVRCGVFVTGGGNGHAILDVPRNPEEVAGGGDRDAIAVALGLTPGEIGFENHKPGVFSAGVAFSFVPVRDLAVIARAKPNGAAWQRAFEERGAFLYCRQTESAGRQFHARMFWPGNGMAEDPATGSAAAAFSEAIRKFDALLPGAHRYVIEQGFEMGRPSLIKLELDVANGEVAAARVGGDAVIVAEGTLNV
ncbi:MAG: PhzF family phenazine biosynthesis protein [Bauldia sp.]